VEADPGDAEIAENLGYALLKAGRTADGKPAILRALTLGPERASAWGTLGLIFAKEGRHADAVACVVTAYRYARNRKRTLDVYMRLAATDEDPRVRSLFSDVVPRISATR
jgi:Flp pilus assembly protein TadD